MFFAFVMKAMGDIDWVTSFVTEKEADEFGIEKTRYHKLDPRDDPAHWEKYDPPVVILFEADDPNAMDNGKYKRPVAIYQRGEKFVCVKNT
jgi:hypothetical protein